MEHWDIEQDQQYDTEEDEQEEDWEVEKQENNELGMTEEQLKDLENNCVLRGSLGTLVALERHLTVSALGPGLSCTCPATSLFTLLLHCTSMHLTLLHCIATLKTLYCTVLQVF